MAAAGASGAARKQKFHPPLPPAKKKEKNIYYIYKKKKLAGAAESKGVWGQDCPQKFFYQNIIVDNLNGWPLIKFLCTRRTSAGQAAELYNWRRAT